MERRWDYPERKTSDPSSTGLQGPTRVDQEVTQVNQDPASEISKVTMGNSRGRFLASKNEDVVPTQYLQLVLQIKLKANMYLRMIQYPPVGTR